MTADEKGTYSDGYVAARPHLLPMVGLSVSCGTGGAGRRLETLAEISRQVDRGDDFAVVANAVVQAVARLLSVQHAGLWLHDDSVDTLRLGAWAPEGAMCPRTVVPVGDSLAGSVLRSGRPYVTREVETDRFHEEELPHADRSKAAALVSFSHRDRSLGVLVALSTRAHAF